VETAADSVRTVCSYCGVGCGIVLEVARGDDGRRRAVRTSGDKGHPANGGRLCTKGVTSADMMAAPGRLTTALVRAERGAQPAATPVDEAVARTARRLREILDEHGPDALSFYVSGQMSLEAQYLANKLAKGFVRTNQIESNSRLCMASAGTGYKLSLGADGPPGSYEDFDQADVFFVTGANMADCHPVLFLRMMDRVKAGARLIVVDPRRSATADKADLFLQIKPGTDLALLNGLLHLLVEDGHTDPGFIAEFTEGWEAMPEFLAGYRPAAVAEITGIPEADIRRAAAWIGEAGEWMSCWTMGLNQSTHGTWNTNALVNLHLATGAICRTGSGPFSLTGQPNAMGGREMGYMGPGLPGQRSVLVDAEREFIENLWGLPPGTVRKDGVGKGTVDMFERMADGRIKACWIICTNPVASVANRKTVIAGLEAADLVIIQDVFAETETSAYADVAFPATLWAESDGVMVNSERNLTLVRGVVDPPSGALPDWELIARVACEMGFERGFTYSSAEEVFEELKQAWNPKTGWDLRGVSYERLRRTPVQWPAADPDGDERNPVRYLNDGVSQTLRVRPDGSRPRLAFPTASGRAVFFGRPHIPPAEMPDDEYPFVLNTGRLQHQWHTLTKTGKVARLNKLNPGPFIEIHPEDAAALHVVDGDDVEAASRRGRVVLPAVVTDRVRPGGCFAPFHWNDLFGEYFSVNAVTNDAVDALSFQPEFKACAVSLVKTAAAAPAPGQGTPEAAAPAPGPAAPEPAAAAVSVLSGLLGLAPAAPPVLSGSERHYLSGFLAGVASAPGGTSVPVLPAGAPVAADHALWVNGMLAGLFSRTAPAPPAAGSVPSSGLGAGVGARQVTVLWASQTGNAEEFAATVTERLAADGRTVTATGMDAAEPGALAGAGEFLVITSTFGDGESPDNGAAFWAALSGPDAPSLEGTRFAVLAFGDSSYDNFCGHGRRLDERLSELGAVRLLPRAECEPDFEETARAWLEQVRAALAAGERAGSAATPARPAAPPGAGTLRPTRTAPYRSRLTGNRLLSLPGAGKEVRRFTFDASDGELAYEAGDALGVWPVNCPDLVTEWLAAASLSREAEVDLPGVGTVPFGEALHRYLDITRVTPELLRFVAEHHDDRTLKQLLRPHNSEELAKWTWGRQTVDLLTDVPVRVSAQEWADVLKRMQPRLYSISSSPLAAPGEVCVTVSVLRYQGPRGNPRKGVASAFLADAALGSSVPLFVQRSPHFRPPADPRTPAIMVGPGTGIAPFMGFLQQRRAQGHPGPNWLFFGEQRAATDFYYRDELEELHRHGTLTRLDTAFSRDQRTKIYVQDRMREHGSRLWAWLQDGAHFYVCGDASRMAKDVDQALREIVAAYGGLTDGDAAAYVKRLAAGKRYVRDIY
jgi:NADPH-dependent sulfite reductase flavoprotein alpha-component